MKTEAIQQQERYEAPRIKVKDLRQRCVICASGSNEGIDEENEGL